jgi:hypothetical protein
MLPAVLLIALCGCAQTVVVVARMPALIPEARFVKTVQIGSFHPRAATPPERAAAVSAMLAAELRAVEQPRVALPTERPQLRISGSVLCHIKTERITPPGSTQPVETRSAEVAITFQAKTGHGMHVFEVTERPTLDDKHALEKRTPPGELPAPDLLATALLRATVRRFAEDISPRKVRVRIPRPVRPFGSAATRGGIDALATDLAAAVSLLERAVKQDGEDAAAFNALGFCAEVTGNLEAAVTNYTYALIFAERDSHREIYSQNLRRANSRYQHRRVAMGEAGGEPGEASGEPSPENGGSSKPK